MSNPPIVCFKWKSPEGFRERYIAHHVNVLYAMLKRHIRGNCDLYCVTDDPKDIRKEVNIVPLWKEPPMPFRKTSGPQCYKRLKLFDKESIEIFGPRIVAMDLDTIIVGDITDLINTPGDFVGYNKKFIPYQGAFWIHQIGTRQYIWDDFDPVESPRDAKRFCGSDQAWLSHKLPAGEKVLTKADGILCYDKDLTRGRALPPHAKIVIFRGHVRPWSPVVSKKKWVQRYYRL